MNNELATIKFRYKNSGESKSLLQKATVRASIKKEKDINDDTRWAIAVAEFGMLLRDSEFIDDGNFEDVIKMTSGARGEDEDGYREEFITA